MPVTALEKGTEKTVKRSRREVSVTVIFMVLLPLFAGTLIYLTADPDVVFLKWMGRGLVSVENVRPVWLTVFRNYGCDMLWACALTSAVILILGSGKRELILAGTLCLGFEAALEAAQTLPSVAGTFDRKDILLEWLVTGTLIFISARKERRNEKRNETDRADPDAGPVCRNGNGQRI